MGGGLTGCSVKAIQKQQDVIFRSPTYIGEIRVNDPAKLICYDKPKQSGLLQLDWFSTYSGDGV